MAKLISKTISFGELIDGDLIVLGGYKYNVSDFETFPGVGNTLSCEFQAIPAEPGPSKGKPVRIVEKCANKVAIYTEAEYSTLVKVAVFCIAAGIGYGAVLAAFTAILPIIRPVVRQFVSGLF